MQFSAMQIVMLLLRHLAAGFPLSAAVFEPFQNVSAKQINYKTWPVPSIVVQ